MAAPDRRQRGAQPGPVGGTPLGARAAPASQPSGGAAPSPEATLVASERREELLAALDTLRDDERLVVECRFFLDLSEEETAAALGVRKGTVKSRQSRALARLREEVEHGD